MAIFKFLYKIIKGFGFLFVLFIFSYVITSITYYSFAKEEKEFEEIEIVHSEKINCIDIYNKDNISINVELKKDTSVEYLVSYAYYYFDKYDKEVYLYLIDEDTLVSIGREEFAIVERLKK